MSGYYRCSSSGSESSSEDENGPVEKEVRDATGVEKIREEKKVATAEGKESDMEEDQGRRGKRSYHRRIWKWIVIR